MTGMMTGLMTGGSGRAAEDDGGVAACDATLPTPTAYPATLGPNTIICVHYLKWSIVQEIGFRTEDDGS